jgi:phospholipase/carboxylesterase
MPIDESAVLWSTPERLRPGKRLLVLLHGYGSHEGDLFALAPYLPLDAVIAAPRAFDPHPMGFGYSWFPLPEFGSGRLDAAPLDAAADQLHDWLRRAGAEASSVGIVGFSQGGIIGMQLARRHPGAIDRLVFLSSMVAPGVEPGDDELGTLPVFWGRGTLDDVIPAIGVRHTLDWLPGRVDLTERVYEDLGHGVDDRVLGDVLDFLART